MSLRDKLRSGALPTADVALPRIGVVVSLRCLAPDDWEDLIDAHPPDDEQRKQGWQWDVKAFRPALLAASVVTPDGEEPLEVRGWTEVAEEGQLTAGELEELFGTAVNLNTRRPSVAVGKGSTQTAS